eukprot:128751-Pleurochrysis_carterae.AAC.2
MHRCLLAILVVVQDCVALRMTFTGDQACIQGMNLNKTQFYPFVLGSVKARAHRFDVPFISRESNVSTATVSGTTFCSTSSVQPDARIPVKHYFRYCLSSPRCKSMYQ